MAAPKGNNFAGNALVAKRALERALAVRSGAEVPKEGIERFSALVAIWDKQIEQALDGNNDSAKFIVERLDGKPKQPVVGGDDDDNPITVVTRIELVPMSGRGTD